MKYFPLKTAILCLVLTPILYIATISGCSHFLKQHYQSVVKNRIIGDSEALLAGSILIEEQVARNITAFLKQTRALKSAGLLVDIRVVTGRGKIIFPLYDPVSSGQGFQNTDTLKTIFGKQALSPQIIAKKNFDIMDAGLNVIVSVKLPHGSRLANLILLLFSAISIAVFFVMYRIGSKKAGQNRRLEEERHEKIVKELEADRQKLFGTIKSLNKKYSENKRKSKINEEEMFQEIVSLEEQLNAYIELKQEKQEEIEELKTTLQKTTQKKGGKAKRNEADHLSKRFAALYKNLLISKKAIDGFLSLEEGQQIKAEEIIHQLNLDPSKVIIKRKVFSGKKNKTTFLEVVFAYNGRLYYRPGQDKIEVEVIGSKNSQVKDMEYIKGF